MYDGPITQEILQITEALLTATPEPLNQARFNQCLEGGDIHLPTVIKRLEQLFEEQERPVEIVKVGEGYQLVTKAEYHPFLKALFHRLGRLNLSRQALEALAVVAYKQPVSRPEVEQIRGVNSDTVLKTLLEKELVTITGRDETVGRPLLYGTTQAFLVAFGLHSLSDMPKLKEIHEIMADGVMPTPMEEAMAGLSRPTNGETAEEPVAPAPVDDNPESDNAPE
jgi:segregation and condensation protein B